MRSWREFLKDLRDAQNAAVTRLAEEIKCIAIEVAQMRESLNRHEINTERRFSGLKRKGVEES